jgi:hypothetical protein
MFTVKTKTADGKEIDFIISGVNTQAEAEAHAVDLGYTVVAPQKREAAPRQVVTVTKEKKDE